MTSAAAPILVTGANGFVGAALAGALVRANVATRCAYRAPVEAAHALPAAGHVAVGEIGPDTDWSAAVAGAGSVVHLAARVHMQQDSSADPLAEYRRVNVEGTLRLARSAAGAGVRRLVFVSSIKVNGEATGETPFRDTDAPAPTDAYGVSKLEAEEGLRQVADATGMELVVVRPPLVYGPGVRANFRRLVRLVARGVPLPLGAVRNRRSLIALDNLVDVLRQCAVHPAAAGRTFLVSDGEDLSTPELIRRLAAAMDRPARLVPVPTWMLRAAGSATGKAGEVSRLVNSLQVDSGPARQLLGWTPPLTVDQALRRAVADA